MKANPDTPTLPDDGAFTLSTAFINGKWLSFDGHRHRPLIDPDTEKTVGSIFCPRESVVDAAVQSAVRAQSDWAVSPIGDRLALLTRITELVEKRSDQLAGIISAEIGAPIDFASAAQVQAAIQHLMATHEALSDMTNETCTGGDPAHRVRYEAVGVAGLITPWNWPLNQVVLKVGAALAAGCAMVLKPSEYATRSAMAFTEIVAEAGVPRGVFNLLIGDPETGAQLVAHPGIDMVSFTGSTRGGQQVMQSASARFARTAMELGGKSPNLLFEDCDLETAVRQGLAHCFRNAGQSCNAASRMLVARPIYDDAVAFAADIAGKTQVGRPFDPGPHIGPLVNRAQFDRVRGFIEAGLGSGARLAAGGPDRPSHLHQGYYVRPTVFADVSPDNTLFQDEIFGPVLTMTAFEDEDHAIQLANATRYGLAAYIQTADPARADRVASKLRAGMVQINGTSRAQGAPFGGQKTSGHGREGGLWGIRSFQEVKSISGLPASPDQG
ncbi:MAG: aldehyde dehydrogenase family protein [Pseudomonadota bacterium]